MVKKGRQGEGGGRKPKYASSKELEKSVQEYFDKCKEALKAPNKAGLCVHLGISRETYNEYRKRFPDTIKACDHYIEDWWVNRLSSNAPTGAIFYLKNAFKENFKDKNETDVTSGGEPITFQPASKMTPEQIDDYLRTKLTNGS